MNIRYYVAVRVRVGAPSRREWAWAVDVVTLDYSHGRNIYDSLARSGAVAAVALAMRCDSGGYVVQHLWAQATIAILRGECECLLDLPDLMFALVSCDEMGGVPHPQEVDSPLAPSPLPDRDLTYPPELIGPD